MMPALYCRRPVKYRVVVLLVMLAEQRQNKPQGRSENQKTNWPRAEH